MSEDKLSHPSEDEQSLKDSIKGLQLLMRAIFRRWKIILLFGLIGLGLGAYYSLSSKPTFTARCTFVLDNGEEKNPLGGLASLGLGGSGNAGLFDEMENIRWLYTSDMMLRRTLLTAVDDGEGGKRLLVDWFIEENGMRKDLDKDKNLSKVAFSLQMNGDSLSRYEGQIISMCIGRLKDKYIKIVDAGPNTEQLLTVLFKSKNELFSKNFTDVLVASVNDYYINTKTEKTRKEVEALQKKADSTYALLNSTMYKTAYSYEAIPYANPNLPVLQVKPQREGIDVQMSTVLLTEVVKNLEARKLALAQETPLIQIIERPAIPLDVMGVPLYKTMIMGFLAFSILTMGVVALLYFYKKIMNS